MKDGSPQYKYGTDVRHCVVAEQQYEVFFWTKEISRHSSCNILIHYNHDCDQSDYSNLDKLEPFAISKSSASGLTLLTEPVEVLREY